MNKKLALYISLAIIVIFIIFMVYDTVTRTNVAIDQKVVTLPDEQPEAMWEIAAELVVSLGDLKAVATTDEGVLIGGDSFIALYNYDLKPLWSSTLSDPIGAIAAYGDTIFASAGETILLFTSEGGQIDEWGPYDDNPLITSVAAGRDYVAFADAGDKVVFVLNKAGALVSLVGQPGNQYVVPSPYFDVSISDDDMLITANPGKRNIEFRTIKGEIISYFGEEGAALEYFCGCCNPSHFAFMQGGNLVTAEKGINRIKIVEPDGELVELVAQPDQFTASVPLDLAVSGKNLIYAANPADSKLYVFKRK
ncbi:MAG TPA: hypothetical protein VMW76_07700 [Bacteroidales bacterium]|nr:hypothetical protein [Bacteroidales bacterium]